MVKHPHASTGLPAKELKVTPFTLPARHTYEHDEWLLDEALIETFPASDPIAVPPDPTVADEAP